MYSKFLLMTLAAGAVLSSCSKDQVVDQAVTNPKDLIQFSTSLKHLSRATEMTQSTLASFKVVGVSGSDEILNQTVTKKSQDGSSDEWIGETDRVWPSSSVSFYGIAPADLTEIASISSKNKKITYTSAQQIGEQKDIVYAYNTTTKVPQVDLRFKHILSDIKVQVSNKSEDKYEVMVSGLRLVNINSQSEFTFPDSNELSGAWSEATTPTTFFGGTFEKPIKATNQAQNITFPSLQTFVQIPQTIKGYEKVSSSSGAYISLLVRIVQIDKEGHRVQIYPQSTDLYAYNIIPLNNNEWVAGKRYTYNINFFSEGNNTGGAGLVDKETNNNSNPKDPNRDKITTTDPYPKKEKGTPIIEASDFIRFKVTVNPWEDEETINIDL